MFKSHDSQKVFIAYNLRKSVIVYRDRTVWIGLFRSTSYRVIFKESGAGTVERFKSYRHAINIARSIKSLNQIWGDDKK